MIPKEIPNENVNYDAEHDVLHVFFPPFDYSFDDEDFPGIILRRSVADERLTGIRIINFLKRNLDELKRVLPDFDFAPVKNKISNDICRVQ